MLSKFPSGAPLLVLQSDVDDSLQQSLHRLTRVRINSAVQSRVHIMTALVVLKLSLVYRNTSLIQQPQQSFGLPCTFPFGGSVESVTAAEVGAIGGKQPECRH